MPDRAAGRYLLYGVVAAALYVAATAIRLDAQGPYYDELHQAAGAFTHLGSPPQMFASAIVGGYPLLNTSYSAAIKTHLYGLYLRAAGRFGLVSWRLTGILFVALAIVGFCWLARAALEPPALAIFLALLLSDRGLLLMTRFDWGPVALALALRLVFLGLWLRGQAMAAPTVRNSFALGLVAGIAIVEKLSSALLLGALALVILLSERRRTLRHAFGAAAGVATGVLPLVLVNMVSLAKDGHLISLSVLAHPADRSLDALLAFTTSFLELANASLTAGLTLGLERSTAAGILERTLLVAALVASAVVALKQRRQAPAARWALVSLAAYAAIGAGLYLLPRPTALHHWVIATPFQYLGIALAASCVLRRAAPDGALAPAPRPYRRRPRRTSVTAAGAALLTVTSLWIASRLPGVAELELALARGRTAIWTDPAFHALGRLAATRTGEAIFVATGWGVGTQIYCFANGRPGLVHDLFWSYRGPDQIADLQRESGARALYLVRLEPDAGVAPEVTRRIEHDVAVDPRWSEVAVEPEVADLTTVMIRKFVSRGSSPARE